jgi:hypothetical protein
MNKLKLSLALLIIVFSNTVMACPNCAGSTDARDKYTVAILSCFILLTYVPFYLIFKKASKIKKTDKL